MWDFLTWTYYGNTVQDYIISFSIIIGTIIILKVFRIFVLGMLKRWSERTRTRIDDFIIMNVERFFLPLMYFFGLFSGIYYLKLSRMANRVLETAMIVVFTYFAIRFSAIIINYAVKFYWEKRDGAEKGDTRLKGVTAFINLTVWGLGAVFLLDNLGFKISAVIAGLGIGGIAVALAAQAVLGDLFSYFVIFLDRPFEVGDHIQIDDKQGVVEFIGIKTTRVAGLGGEQLVFSNSDLTRSRIHNYKRMLKRRISFTVRVIYQTPLYQLKEIPGIIEQIVGGIEAAKLDRAHFSSLGDSSLNFEVVYYVLGSDYTKYMDIQQEINLRVIEEFQKRNIGFAYPTQKIIYDQTERA